MSATLQVRIYSFSFLYSQLPEDPSGNRGGFIFDCRCLPNPGREPAYADLTGLDQAVIMYLRKQEEVTQFLNLVFELVGLAVDNYQNRGFTSLMVSFGCTGGQHRSVYCAERLASYLVQKNVAISLHHVGLEQ